MYLKTERQLPLENFYLPFGGQLDPENRWVKLSKLIPWDVIEDKYAALFAKNNTGAPAKPVRMA
ncbi:IS5/IS1182 family transposase, partial [Hydrogenispora sp. UU3]|nr:IS5/IS1182 family transposase [Capillibacterium thermochitinicola]